MQDCFLPTITTWKSFVTLDNQQQKSKNKAKKKKKRTAMENHRVQPAAPPSPLMSTHLQNILFFFFFLNYQISNHKKGIQDREIENWQGLGAGGIFRSL
jgi:hypothetical protein